MSSLFSKVRNACALGVALRVLALPTSVFAAPPEAEPLTGRVLYERACAACHGSDGRGNAAALAAYPISPPDFTDCSFASREPDNDWIAVAHKGGPARGFDRLMPSFAELLSAEELQRIVDYIRSFCTEGNWPRGELNLPRALVTSKAFPEDEAALRLAADETEVTTRLVYARRLGAKNQLEFVVPVTVLDSGSGSWTGGVGDLTFAFKRVLLHGLDWGGILSAAVELSVPTGSTERGIGSGTTAFEPFVAYGLLLSRRSFVQFQLGGLLPYERDHADELFARSVAGWRLIQDSGYGRAWTPMLEVLGSRELVSASTTHVDLVPELQVTLSARQHVVANAGVRIPLNDRIDRPTQVMAYLIWDWFDGGFFTGW